MSYYKKGAMWTFECPCKGEDRRRVHVELSGESPESVENDLKTLYPDSVTMRVESHDAEIVCWFHDAECHRRDTEARQIGDVDLMKHFAWEDDRARLQTDRLAWYMKNVPLSPRGRVLVLEPRPNGRDVPFVCVELSSKWYSLFVVDAEGFVEAVDFSVLKPFAAMNGGGAYVDHVPNPDAVESWARSMGYYVDDCSMDMMIGRWNMEVMNR